jgi:hypothetical protein
MTEPRDIEDALDNALVKLRAFQLAVEGAAMAKTIFAVDREALAFLIDAVTVDIAELRKSLGEAGEREDASHGKL